MRLPLTPFCLLAPLMLASCDPAEEAPPSASSPAAAPTTPAAMYAEAERLIKPHVEGEASDFEGALRWLTRSAEAGYLKAQTDLGGIYLYGGRGVEADAKEAQHWFQRAAEQGSREAELFLGNILYQGSEGIPRDVEGAMQHWTKAADAGLAEAQLRLGHAYAQSADTMQKSLPLLESAAKAGLAKAALDLGYLYASGAHGLTQDMDKARGYYEQAAQMGDVKALHVLAILHMEEGKTEEALNALRLSAGQDYAPAMKMLIDLLHRFPDDAQLQSEAAAWEKRLEGLRGKKPTQPGVS